MITMRLNGRGLMCELLDVCRVRSFGSGPLRMHGLWHFKLRSLAVRNGSDLICALCALCSCSSFVNTTASAPSVCVCVCARSARVCVANYDAHMPIAVHLENALLLCTLVRWCVAQLAVVKV